LRTRGTAYLDTARVLKISQNTVIRTIKKTPAEVRGQSPLLGESGNIDVAFSGRSWIVSSKNKIAISTDNAENWSVFNLVQTMYYGSKITAVGEDDFIVSEMINSGTYYGANMVRVRRVLPTVQDNADVKTFIRVKK
jgi:hypothetical protein